MAAQKGTGVEAGVSRLGGAFLHSRGEGSNSCEGLRRLRRKQEAGAGAAVGKGERAASREARAGHRNP